MDKLAKVRAEIERTMKWEKEQAAHSYGNVCLLHECREDMCKKFLSFIDSMQEEPVSIWHDASETPSIFGTYLLVHEDGWCVARYYGKDVPTGNITGWVEISQHIFIEKPKKWLDLREILPKTK